MKINDFFKRTLGYIPFNVDGNIYFENGKVIIKVFDMINGNNEKFIEKFILRLTKKQIKLELIERKPIEYLVENWLKIIKDHYDEIYLKQMVPVVENQTLIFRVPNHFAISRLRKDGEELEEIIEKNLGYVPKYKLVYDNSLKEIIEPKIEEKVVEQSSKEISNSENEIEEIIYGEDFKKVPIKLEKIDDIAEEGKRVVVAGKVFYKEYDEKAMKLILYITDYTDSITVKAFGAMAEVINEELEENSEIIIDGKLEIDYENKEYMLVPINIKKYSLDKRMDNYHIKRVELHAHTKMSSMDSVLALKDLVETAAKWGHKALAITDHGVVQAIPTFYNLAKEYGIKPIFGMEGYLVNELVKIVENLPKEDIKIEDATFVVLDFETTGFSPNYHEIIEIGAVKIKGERIVDRYHKLVKPKGRIPKKTEELTGITLDMLENERRIEEVLPEFLEFIKGSVLVAHNAEFDYTFLKAWTKKVLGIDINIPYIDTLALSKALLNISSFSLDKVVKHLKLGEFRHHRAHEDAEVTAKVFLKLKEKAYKGWKIKTLKDFGKLNKNIDPRNINPYHITILVKNKKGLRNLYKLVSKSHIEYFYRVPRILMSELVKHREGLLIGAGCLHSELAERFLRGADPEEIEELVKFYDFIEIQPLDSIDSNISKKRVKEMYRIFYDIAKKLDIPVVMTGNVHYLRPEDKKIRMILKKVDSDMTAEHLGNRYFRTTEEMLRAAYEIFENMSIAKEIVIENTNKIADMIEEIQPLSGKLNPPKIENADEILKEMAINKAKEMYGDPLPEIVKNRLEKELNAIINHGYSVLYLIAQKIVQKSLEDGYLVGSRGSVGSSLVATMIGITEVNPLPPHYVCPKCKYTEFHTDEKYGSGYDLPDKLCPKCKTKLIKNGQDIPFETFMGFEGDKVPDIDLNFSGEYQSRAHKYLEELFGKDHVFRAGTISTIAEKTAFGFVRKYVQKSDKPLREAEIYRIAKSIEGVKRTTGQHPGGLMIVPKDRDIYDFTPIQYPANKKDAGTITTHFDYEVIHDDLVKLDALGHDDPTFLKMLHDLTGFDPLKVPMDDKKTISIFSSTRVLGVDLNKYLGTKVGTLGIPEFGTQFVRGILEETKPTTFAELVRISGLSHGTDVWAGNARDIIIRGDATLNEVISCRDDIMNYLIHKGVEPKIAFKIMEKVRKGKGVNEEEIQLMKDHDVPEWFIQSCQKISYLFPKAHAVAYVSMGFRIAYYKVHYPLEFYATYFTVKGDEFNLEAVLKGKDAIKTRIYQLRAEKSLDVKKRNELSTLEIALEMLLRGFGFLPPDLYKSDSKKFIIENRQLRIPLVKIPNLGEKAVENIIKARKKGEFKSIEDLVNRAKLNKAALEALKKFGVLKDLPETNQVSLF